MKATEFKKGQSVVVTTKNGCTFEADYSVDYLKEGKTWTMICVPARAIELA